MYPHPPKGVPFNGNPFRNPLESPGYKSSCAPSALSRASRRIITFGNFQRSPPETSTKWASFINDSIYIGVTWLTPVTHENSRHFFGGWFFSTTITPFLTIVRALILYVYIYKLSHAPIWSEKFYLQWKMGGNHKWPSIQKRLVSSLNPPKRTWPRNSAFLTEGQLVFQSPV